MDKILHRVENMQSKEPKRRTQNSASGRPKRDPSANKSRAANSPARSTRTNGPEASHKTCIRPMPMAPGGPFDVVRNDQTHEQYEKLIEQADSDLSVEELDENDILECLRILQLPITIMLVGPSENGGTHLAVSWRFEENAEDVTFLRVYEAWLSFFLAHLFPLCSSGYYNANANLFLCSKYGTRIGPLTYEDRKTMNAPSYFALFGARLSLTIDSSHFQSVHASLHMVDYSGKMQKFKYYNDFSGEFKSHFPQMKLPDNAMTFARDNFPEDQMLGPWNSAVLGKIENVQELIDAKHIATIILAHVTNHKISIRPYQTELVLVVHREGEADSMATVDCALFCLIFEKIYRFFENREDVPACHGLMHALIQRSMAHEASILCDKTLADLQELGLVSYLQAMGVQVMVEKKDPNKKETFKHLSVYCYAVGHNGVVMQPLRVMKSLHPGDIKTVMKMWFPKLPIERITPLKKLFMEADSGKTIGPKPIDEILGMTVVDYLEEFQAKLKLYWYNEQQLSHVGANILWRSEEYEYHQTTPFDHRQFVTHFPKLRWDESVIGEVITYLQRQDLGPWPAAELRKITNVKDMIDTTVAKDKIKADADKALGRKLDNIAQRMNNDEYKNVIADGNLSEYPNQDAPIWMECTVVGKWCSLPESTCTHYRMVLKHLFSAYVLQTEEGSSLTKKAKIGILKRTCIDHEFALSQRALSLSTGKQICELQRMRYVDVVKYSDFVVAVAHYARITDADIYEINKHFPHQWKIWDIDTMNRLLDVVGAGFKIVHNDAYTVVQH